jgi:hypothetical protein
MSDEDAARIGLRAIPYFAAWAMQHPEHLKTSAAVCAAFERGENPAPPTGKDRQRYLEAAADLGRVIGEFFNECGYDIGTITAEKMH